MTDNEQAPLPVEESPDVTTPQPSGESPTPVVKRKKQWWIIPLIALAVIVILLTGGFFGVRWLEQRNIASAQQKLAASQYAEAEKDLETLIKIPVQLLVSPSDIYSLRGEARFKQGRDAEALTDLKTAQQFNPNSARTVLLETEILYKQGNTDLALESARKANGLDDTLSFPYALMAEDAYRTGDLATALEKADAAITRNDDSGIAHRVRGSILAWQSDYTPALEDLKQASTLNPDDVVAQAMQVYVLVATNKIDEAKTIVDSIPAEKEGESAVLWVKSILVNWDYKDKEANDLINQAIEADPNRPEYYVTRYEFSNTYDEEQQRLKDLEKALELSPEFIPALESKMMYQITNWEITDIPSAVEPFKTKAPQSMFAPVSMAIYYERQYDYDKAKEAINEAINQHPENYGLYVFRSNLYLTLSDFKNAQADLKKAVELFPKSSSVLIGQSNYALAKEDFTQALNFANQALKIHPDSSSVYAQIAFVNCSKGSIIPGRTAVDSAVKIDPKSSDVLMAATYISLAENDTVSALNHANTLVELHPKNPGFLALRGNVYLQMQQIAKARKDATAVLKMSEKNTSGLSLMVKIGIAEKNYDTALKNAEYLVRVDPKNVSNQMVLANAQIINSDPDKALETLKQVEKLTPDSLEVQKLLGHAYYLQGDLENAKKIVDNVITREKDLSLSNLEEDEHLQAFLKYFKPAGDGKYTYTDETLKFSITLPAGWVPSRPTDEKQKEYLVLVVTPKNSKGVNFKIEFDKYDGGTNGITPAMLAVFVRTAVLAKSSSKFESIEPSKSLKGSKVPVVMETFKIEGGKQKFYYAVAPNHLVFMYLTSPLSIVDDIDKYKEEVDAAVASFTLLK